MKVSKCPKCLHYRKIGYEHNCELNPRKTVLGQMTEEVFIENCHFFKEKKLETVQIVSERKELSEDVQKEKITVSEKKQKKRKPKTVFEADNTAFDFKE